MERGPRGAETRNSHGAQAAGWGVARFACLSAPRPHREALQQCNRTAGAGAALVVAPLPAAIRRRRRAERGSAPAAVPRCQLGGARGDAPAPAAAASNYHPPLHPFPTPHLAHHGACQLRAAPSARSGAAPGVVLPPQTAVLTLSLQSDDEVHNQNFETAHAGASLTYPMQCSALRKSGHVVIKGRPCKVRRCRREGADAEHGRGRGRRLYACRVRQAARDCQAEYRATASAVRGVEQSL
jgi:hypothetical protein